MKTPPFWQLFRKDSSKAIAIIAVVSLTGVMGHRFYNQPKLKEGTIASQTIKAPATAIIKDDHSTQIKRQEASKSSIPVWMHNRSVEQKINQDLQKFLALGSKLRQIAGPFPYTEASILSVATQLYLRECPKSEFQKVIAAVDHALRTSTNVLARDQKAAIAQAAAELQAYRLSTSSKNYSTLLATISKVRQRYTQVLSLLKDEEFAKIETLDRAWLLELLDKDWWETRIGILDVSERMLTQGIPPGLPANILQQAIGLQVKTLVPKDAEPLANKLLLAVLQPNLKKDEEQTKLQQQQAEAAVAPVMIEVQKNQVIVQAGGVISHEDFLLLEHFGLSHREINWLGLLQWGGIVTGAVVVFGLVERRSKSELRQSDRLLVLLLTLSASLLVKLRVPYSNLPAIGLLLGSFYGSGVGVIVVGLLTVLLPVSLGIGWEYLLPGAAGGLLGGFLAGRMRSREELALLGGAVGLTKGLVYLVWQLLFSTTVSSIGWYALFQEAALQGLSGLAWSIAALGLSPYLEQLFDLVTPIRLAELSNLNRPLLKRLATETPGTFQHTLFVSTLAEAAAKALECNVELVRAGTLYHDIGKMHDPLAFIENQMDCSNKHDEMGDPWKSASVIKKHVSEGLVMARKYRLPTAIQAFIPEHQGTMMIGYFYYQAQQLLEAKGKDSHLAPDAERPLPSLRESDFRYNGPIPQSRETGIVMLADSCEAALRSLKDATVDEALAMVNKILRARWQDNQLIDSGLTREEMSQIAKIFVEVWQQFNHKRIPYPKRE